MENFIIERDGQKSLRFTGKLVAKASSSDSTAAGRSYSGETGRWQVLRLYKTQTGKYVCQRVNYTRWDGERDKFEARVCSTQGEVSDFFGYGRLARDLYEAVNIEDIKDADTDKNA